MKTFSLVAASLALLSGLAAAEDDKTTSYSTVTSTRTVMHVVTETHYSSTEIETSTELIPTPVTVTPTNTPVTTPMVYSAGNSTTPVGTGGFVSSAIQATSSAAGVAASASPSSPSTGSASSLKIDAAVAAIVAGAGYLLL
ncbi:hypothetical protein SLS57_005024 [Botryosphaeria dothidea]|uniref:Mucin-5ac-like n=1 Tax=Botryosphaeria dothidea TaxID=55169 RepID=A0A8H4IZC7_9PEZI|nr:mucin-5ac-like [Botryosphaeria dothidea]